MSDLPDPPVPADIDVRDLDGFLLNVERLLASELVALGTPEECWAALMLWCRAWKQKPGGSLPDDDRVLASFSRAGKRWKKIKTMALRGFIRCSDGRLYHPVLCEDVLRAAAKKTERKERTKAATAARIALRDVGRDEARNVVRNVARGTRHSDERDVANQTNVTLSQGQGQLEETPLESNITKSPHARGGASQDRPAQPAAAERFAFDGRVISLKQADYDRWKAQFSAIPDFDAELETIDSKFAEQGVQPGKWFGKTAAWLQAKHERISKNPGEKINGAVSTLTLPLEEVERRNELLWRLRLGAFQRGAERWMGEWGQPPTHERCWLRVDPSLQKHRHLLAEFGFEAPT